MKKTLDQIEKVIDQIKKEFPLLEANLEDLGFELGQKENLEKTLANARGDCLRASDALEQAKEEQRGLAIYEEELGEARQAVADSEKEMETLEEVVEKQRRGVKERLETWNELWDTLEEQETQYVTDKTTEGEFEAACGELCGELPDRYFYEEYRSIDR